MNKKLVPVHPTEQMMLAGEAAFCATGGPGVTWAEHTGSIYSAMVKAAPDMAVDLDRLRAEVAVLGVLLCEMLECNALGEGADNMPPELLSRWQRACYEHIARTPNVQATPDTTDVCQATQSST